MTEIEVLQVEVPRKSISSHQDVVTEIYFLRVEFIQTNMEHLILENIMHTISYQ